MLNISDCQLTTLPPALALCTRLEELDVSRNPLGQVLPPLLSHLKSLRVLLADQVELAVLPDWLPDLTQLKVLSASHNALTHLPPSMHQLVHLERLILDHNPWSPTWTPVLAAIVHGPSEEADLPLASHSSVALDSPSDDEEADDATHPAHIHTKTPPRILSALRSNRPISDKEPKTGSKSARSSISLHGLGARKVSGNKKGSTPSTPLSSAPKLRTRRSFGSSDDKGDRSKWSFSLRRGKALKLEPPPLPFQLPRNLMNSVSSTLKLSRPAHSGVSPATSTLDLPSVSAPGLASTSASATASASTAPSAPLTPLDVRRFSGFNFWEELSQQPSADRTGLASPMAFRSPLPDCGLAAPLSFLPVAHSTPPVVTQPVCHSQQSQFSEDDDPWTHRQAVEHRLDIKHLLAYLRDMHDLQTAQRAYEAAAAAAATVMAVPPGLSSPSGTPSSPAQPGSGHEQGLPSSLPAENMKRMDDPILRRRIIEEIVKSEESYVKGMQEFMDVYVTAAQQSDPSTSAPVIPLAEQQIVFGNFPTLVKFHTHAFLPALQEATRSLEADLPSVAAAEQVAEVFLSHSAFFRMYTNYINNCDLAQYLVALWDGLPVPAGMEARLAALLHAPSSTGSPAPVSPVSEMAASLSAPSGELSSTPTSPLPPASMTTSRTSSSLAPAVTRGSFTPLLTPTTTSASALFSTSPTATPTTATHARGPALSKSARKARQRYLRRCAANPRRSHISIESYLMLPVQRVPRYRLLLEALVKATPASSAARSPTPHSLSNSHAHVVPTSPAPSAPASSVTSVFQDAASLGPSPRSSLISTSEAPWIATAAALASAIDSVPDTLETELPALCAANVTTDRQSDDPLPSLVRKQPQQAQQDSRLDRALVQVRDLAHTINESKRRAEQNCRLVEWQARIAGSFPSPLVQPHRRLVRDGVVILRKFARLTTEATYRPACGADAHSLSSEPLTVPVLQQTVVEQPVVLLLCNDLAVFLQAASDSLPMLRAAGEDAAAQAAVTEAMAASASSYFAGGGEAAEPMHERRRGSMGKSALASETHTPPPPTPLEQPTPGVARPPPPDSTAPLLQSETQLIFEVFAILRTGWAPSFADDPSTHLAPGAAVERVDKTTLKVMDHTKLFWLSAQSPGDADAWMAAFQQALPAN